MLAAKEGALKVGINSSEARKVRAYYYGAYTMTENTTSSFAADILSSDDKPVWFRTRAKQNSLSRQNFHPTRTLSFGSSTMHPSHFSNSQTFATAFITL